MTATATPTREQQRKRTPRVCHLSRDGKIAACGASLGEAHGFRWTPTMTTCPRHGLPICPTCAAICGTYLKSEIWEGA